MQIFCIALHAFFTGYHPYLMTNARAITDGIILLKILFFQTRGTTSTSVRVGRQKVSCMRIYYRVSGEYSSNQWVHESPHHFSPKFESKLQPKENNDLEGTKSKV